MRLPGGTSHDSSVTLSGVIQVKFLTNQTHFVRLPGSTSHASSVMLSGVPHGTVLCPTLFLIMISDIIKDISSSNRARFANDTRVYNHITQIETCDNLQSDLNTIYDVKLIIIQTWLLYMIISLFVRSRNTT